LQRDLKAQPEELLGSSLLLVRQFFVAQIANLFQFHGVSLSNQRLAFSFQPSAISYQLSAISFNPVLNQSSLPATPND
jgi:hypothetical protein